MTIVVIRPQPGNDATIAALRAQGLPARALPFFETRPVAWTPPDPAMVDALLFTSAQGVMLAGPGLAKLADRPAVAVGPATAAAARSIGLSVVLEGKRDAAAVVAAARAIGLARLLHLAGRDRVATGAMERIVYAADPLPVTPDAIHDLRDCTVLLHSARAARHLAQSVDDHAVPRATIALVAISAKTAEAAGPGWRSIVTADAPRDDAMVAAARTLTRTAATGISGG
ncbi:uroporphyrinogen-III synthase [Sphingomonadaceae bacterium jetA1]|jgi:uroporphyrinogen-III synthase|uniref:uroporphyrinogen-III synthase n=1 Tax=Facivitalis istanbulensis TaxID=3075838 RepID=UPI00349504B1